MKILIINNSDGGLFLFRGALIKRMISDGYEVVTISPYENGYITEIQELGARTYEINFSGHSTGLFNGIKIIIEIYKIIKFENPDIVHSFTHKPNIFGAMAAKKAGVSNIIMTLTGLGTLFTYNDFKTRLIRNFLIWQYKYVSKFATSIICQNPDDLNDFKSFKIGDTKKYVLVNGSGIDLNDFSMPTTEEIQKSRMIISAEIKQNLLNKKIVLFPARALKEKGFFEFYEAAKIINSLTNEYIFVHLGLVDKHSKYGVTLDSINEFSNECGVHYLGFKNNIQEYMTASDIVVLASYREGTPRSLIEALALNKMIITTNTPGCKETVIDGWNGYYCHVNDTNSLVSKLMCSEDIIEKIENRSRIYCEKKYNVNLQYEVLVKLYKGIEK